MTTLKPMWKDGVFMMPQHLQLLDTYHEQMLSKRIDSFNEHSWGVSDLEVDPDELARGIFRVSACTAVMPDGTLVQVGKEHQLKGLAAMTSDGLAGGGQTVDVMLALPSADVGGAASEDDPAAGTRFLQSVETIPDTFGAAQDAVVDCVRPNVQLLMGHESQQSFVTIKLAELMPDESGQLSVNQNYVPPCLKVKVSPQIMASLSRLVSAMGAKQKDLVSKYGNRTAAIVEFGAADLSTFFFLHTVNSWLPIFMHYADGGKVHPEQLYLSLASFAGELSTFESGTDPLSLPRFQLNDLSTSLISLFDVVFRLLGTVVSSRYQTIPLEQTQPGLFVGTTDDPQILRKFTLYLIAGGDLPEDTLRNDIPRYIKVGSIDQISQIVHSALPGVAVQVDFSPPSAIPVRAHMVYLQLQKQGHYWDAIVNSGSIAIYQPVQPEQVKLELVAVE